MPLSKTDLPWRGLVRVISPNRASIPMGAEGIILTRSPTTRAYLVNIHGMHDWIGEEHLELLDSPFSGPMPIGPSDQVFECAECSKLCESDYLCGKCRNG